VGFDTTAERTVTMRAGISFVDLDGARRNLEAEAPTFDFDAMRREARSDWNRELARVEVAGGGEPDLRSFYTALYHSQLHPNVFNDVDGRYRGFDDRIHHAGRLTHYANFSLWDLYKSQNQLLALIQPERYREMLRSLLAAYRQAGKLPRWGEQNFDAAHMSGDPAIPAIAEGVCRGLVDRTTAEALYRAAADLTQRRRPELDRLGYLPMSPGTTLEFGVADFALALIADALGHDGDARRRLSDSLRYRSILDPETRWIRPRNADGSWHSPFDPTDETGFQEGNSWQYSWLLPHDARGLFDRMGGNSAVIERLDELFRLPPEALSRLNVFGLVYRTATYAPGNEHDLQVPWMYPFALAPWRTMDELRDLQGLFRPTPDGLPGNDDLGGLSAWHVFSALGFGPVTPGAPFYVLGSPQFPQATLRVPGRPSFSIEAPGTSLLNRYVRSARVGGRPLGRAWFENALLERGGALELEMGSGPDTSFGAGPREAPPSAGDPLASFGCRRATTSLRREAPARVRIRASVRPRRVAAGERVRFRFRARVRKGGRRRPVRGALVRFAGRTKRTDRRGRATIAASLGSPRRYRAVVAKRGMRPARIAVRAYAARSRSSSAGS
jgi:predicted alpha-1,2-mannosidase